MFKIKNLPNFYPDRKYKQKTNQKAFPERSKNGPKTIQKRSNNDPKTIRPPKAHR